MATLTIASPAGIAEAARSLSIQRWTWERRYVVLALSVDITVSLLGVACGAVASRLWLGFSATPAPPILAGMIALWIAAVAMAGGYQKRFVGHGNVESHRIFLAMLMLAAGIGFVSWLTQVDVPRSFVLVSLPITAIGTSLGRCLLQRIACGHAGCQFLLQRTLLVGTPEAVERLSTILRRSTHHSYQLMGACVFTDPQSPTSCSLPVFGDLDSIRSVVSTQHIDTVVLAAESGFSSSAIRHLAWRLEGTGASIVIAPGVSEVSGSRVAVRPVNGLLFLYVEQPCFRGLRHRAKEVGEPLLAGVGLVLLAPVLAVIALLIKLDSPGPVFFRQSRIGLLGRSFQIIKYRTMVADAEARKSELLGKSQSNGPLFKIEHDPRITRVGALLRKTSLDELPQLFNVLRGEMSLVGPRPHLPEELAQFGQDSSRRLLVKPGMTGIWQVSGRSDLPHDDAMRLDLSYVDNWSLHTDASIICRTLAVIVDRHGAY